MKTIIFNVLYLGNCGCGFSRKVERTIELKENQTLDDLHEAIIYRSFRWDDPHMYSFFFDNKPFSQNREMEYTNNTEGDIFSSEVPNSSDIELKSLNLKEKQKFLFIFDFGDDHHFGIKVERFGETEKDKRYPNIVKEIGKASKQHP